MPLKKKLSYGNSFESCDGNGFTNNSYVKQIVTYNLQDYR